MTHIIIALGDGSFMYRSSDKSPEEILREIEIGVYSFPDVIHDPVALRQQNYLLIAERDGLPLLSKKQRNVLDLLSMGASETEIGRAMGLSYSGVRHHVESLKRKFCVTTREELIAAYIRMFGR